MPTPRPYPLFLDLAGRPVLIVGGGNIALRKFSALLDAGAAVTIVSPRYIRQLADTPGARRLRAPYASRHMTLKPWRLVFAATDSPAVNEQVQRDAARCNILCCRCDDARSADFTNGAAAAIPGATIAVSTHGASPKLAVRIRDQAAAAVDPVLTQLASLFENWRTAVKTRLADPSSRRLLLLKLAGEEMEQTLRSRGAAAAKRLFEHWLKQHAMTPAPPKSVVSRKRNRTRKHA